MKRLSVILLLAAALPAQTRVKDLNIRILSTMLADDDGVGEWGFAALVEVDGHRILFDTGARPDTVLTNARELKIDLTGVTDVILSHNHSDHTGGLLTLRRELAKQNPKALSRAHAGKGIFLTRVRQDGQEITAMAARKAQYESGGGSFVEYAKPVEIFPAVWLTGPVPRIYPERNWSGSLRLRGPKGDEGEDNLPEDQSLIFDTGQGLVVLSGCGHSGIVNTIEYARKFVRPDAVLAAVGGFHLYQLNDTQLEWTAGKLKGFGLANFLGAHCTGIEATYRIRQLTGLTRRTCAVGAVGGGFVLGEGLRPGSISR